jgi:hypothetical protein
MTFARYDSCWPPCKVLCRSAHAHDVTLAHCVASLVAPRTASLLPCTDCKLGNARSLAELPTLHEIVILCHWAWCTAGRCDAAVLWSGGHPSGRQPQQQAATPGPAHLPCGALQPVGGCAGVGGGHHAPHRLPPGREGAKLLWGSFWKVRTVGTSASRLMSMLPTCCLHSPLGLGQSAAEGDGAAPCPHTAMISIGRFSQSVSVRYKEFDFVRCSLHWDP